VRKSIIARLALVAVLSAALSAGWSIGRPTPARAGEPDFFAFSAGGFDVNDDETAADFRVEYRSDMRFWKLVPFIGLAGTSDAAVYGYAGLGTDIFLGRRVVLQPNAAFVGYHKGNGKDLGGEFQFRTGGEIAWRFDDWSRLAIAFHHISNAGIYDANPGTELLVLTYSVPFTQAPD